MTEPGGLAAARPSPAAQERLDHLRALLEARGLTGVVITFQPTLSWLFGGRFHVNVASEQGLAAVLVDGGRVACLVNNIEAVRLAEEEGLFADEWLVVPWYDEAERRRRLAAWLQRPGVVEEAAVADDLRRLRARLDDAARRALSALALDAARAVEEAGRSLQPEDPEWAAAAAIARGCLAVGAEPVVLLAAGARRALRHRHPVPTGDLIGPWAILSVGARRGGLVASVTRMVGFAPVPEEILAKHRAVIRVDARMLRASVPGATLAEVFECAKGAYAEVGHPEEWRAHHQGGLAGYQSRERRADPAADEVLTEGQAVAWNPTIAGVKSEDTALVAPEGARVLSDTGAWPMEMVDVDGWGILRPALWVR
ncbi:M24 family metallopeptidase [Alicyclobacillus sp.]|uniref:M24 family metallopeptidase n=1 Tax=Alicyclobacillus sp. TaxID=61169 RepID=UPI0025C1A4F1|nr:M24 family metallopeptidase [Alicyclobacillus sp.]MCL6516934.1 aminopeptidase P family N-terminal domain-containing protein [Alicyclobacillus sp.]